MKTYPVVIIGGGASGLFLSSLISNALLLEKNNRCGLKLLLTGNGQCNLTHNEERDSFVRHYYEKRAFVTPSFYNLSPLSIREYFKTLGLETYVREDNKVFPISNNSEDVVSLLLSRSKNIIYGADVKNITKDSISYIIKTDKDEIRANIVVVATGGKSYKKTGSDGSGYSILKNLNHTIVAPSPSLTPINVEEDISKLEGISLENVRVKIGDKTTTGAIVFTRQGLSGPAILNISRYQNENKCIKLSLYALKKEDLKKESGEMSVLNGLYKITHLPHRLLLFLFPFSNKKIADVTKIELNEITETLNELKLTIRETKNFDKAMVTRGGVSTAEVNKNTMESKINKDLYIIGELLDVDGECGGYNLSFCFSSAYSAYLDIKTKI